MIVVGRAKRKVKSDKKLSVRKRPVEGLSARKLFIRCVSSANEKEENVEDLYAEMDVAFESGLCPECGSAVKFFENENEKGLECADCGWAFSMWGTLKDFFPKYPRVGEGTA